VTGWTHFDGSDRTEARRLLDLRYELSAMVARRYVCAGFTAVVQDNIYGDDVVRWLERIDWSPLHLVVLRPSIETLERRELGRRSVTGKRAYTETFTAADNDADLTTTDRSRGLWLDTTAKTPDETVEEILARADDARVA
jgi:hypothetical protein